MHAFDPGIVPQCLPEPFWHDSAEGTVKHRKALNYINSSKQKQIRICQFIEARGKFVSDRTGAVGQSPGGRKVQEFWLRGRGETPHSLIDVQFVRVCMIGAYHF